MANGTEANILEALLQHLELMVFTPSLEIALPGIDFPAVGQAKPDNFLRVDPLINDVINVSIGAGRQQHPGILQVSVMWTKGAGFIKPLAVADAIVAHFAKNTVLYSSGVRVVIYDKPSVSTPLQDTDRVMVPVSIRYHSFNA